MESLNRKALLAFLVFLVLDLLLRLWVSQGPTGPEGVETLTMDPEQVSALEIQAGKNWLLLERTPQGFKRIGASKEAPTKEPQGMEITSKEPLSSTTAKPLGGAKSGNLLTSTQAQEVEVFLKRICSMVREPVGELAGENDSTYGLDPEQGVSIRLQWLQTTQNPRSFTVRFGRILPLNVMYVYGAFADKPGLFKVLRTYKESAVSLLHRLSQ